MSEPIFDILWRIRCGAREGTTERDILDRACRISKEGRGAADRGAIGKAVEYIDDHIGLAPGKSNAEAVHAAQLLLSAHADILEIKDHYRSSEET
ncbi:hypothetical protein ACFOY4_01615 [Actinomadura syzygii]|uniref:Uncharacterized protein n=1 Tax=Actinomadura syzygii TaxID=1427538 RepID=A0A5D0TQZ9_9ACTN|nr:hypothetical protein [Actinomadura syzygii]TYC08558.1 hypothetical protein FXF65_37315 [Actinomadura syzygii]